MAIQKLERGLKRHRRAHPSLPQTLRMVRRIQEAPGGTLPN